MTTILVVMCLPQPYGDPELQCSRVTCLSPPSCKSMTSSDRGKHEMVPPSSQGQPGVLSPLRGAVTSPLKTLYSCLHALKVQPAIWLLHSSRGAGIHYKRSSSLPGSSTWQRLIQGCLINSGFYMETINPSELSPRDPHFERTPCVMLASLVPAPQAQGEVP